MTINTKGMRPIIVENVKYYWRFGSDVTIFTADGPFSQLTADFGRTPDWMDMSDPDWDPRPWFKSRTVTPKHIREAILFAREAGWREGKFDVIYRNDKFEVKSK